MKVRPYIVIKLDPILHEALEKAHEDEILRIIMILNPDIHPTDIPNKSESVVLDKNYSSLQKSREKAIKDRQEFLAQALDPIVQKLKDLHLEVHRMKTGRAAIVDGSAKQILIALEILEVIHASLDTEFFIDKSYSSVQDKKLEK